MTETLAPVACSAPLGAPVLSDEEALASADLFRALGDAHRVKIINLLATGRTPVSVEEFIDPLGLSQPTVSHHLRKLAEADLLDRRQQGQRAYYSLNKEALRTLAAVADLKRGC